MSQTSREDVLLVFKNNPAEMSTSDVASVLYPEEYSKLEEVLNSSYDNSQETREAKSRKAALHRKALYHLNSLEEDGLLRMVRRGPTGEKYYELNLKENEEIMLKGYKKREVILSKTDEPLLPIERYEGEGVIVKFSENDWLKTVNALLLDLPDLKDVYQVLGPLYREVNDVIALNGFTGHVNSVGEGTLKDFAQKVWEDCKDFDRRCVALIDVGGLSSRGRDNVLSLMEDTRHGLPIVFETDTKEFQDNLDFFEDVFSSVRTDRLFFRNKDLHGAPCFMGRAGPYTFDTEEWDETGEDPRIRVASRTTLMLDIKRFAEAFPFSFDRLEDLLHKSLKSLFRANTAQRRKGESRFQYITNISEEGDPFELSRNYLRFWNYDYFRLSYDADVMEGAFRHLKKKTDRFCTSQESIYTSCGMPTRFRTAFSLADSSLSSDFRTSLDKSRLEISALNDLYADGFRENMNSKELLSEMFDGCFRLTVHKNGRYDPEEAVREVNVILSTYKIPFFAYATGSDSQSVRGLESFL